MAKCVLLFLFLIIIACSTGDKEEDFFNTRWFQNGGVSSVEINGQILRIDTLKDGEIFTQNRKFLQVSDDLWIFEIGDVSVWRIDGDIPDEKMFLQENSVAILGADAALPKVLALKFSIIILLPGFSRDALLEFIQTYKGVLMNANNDNEIILTTDGVFWYL
ncbi:MAG: hypothetical protein FWF51_07770 [Chitinivibrionia bacterium]|nr:hypothetical protein [Chitinivibrionia bacterium]